MSKETTNIKHKGRKKKPQYVVIFFVILLSFIFVYPFWQTAVLSVSDKVYANSPGFKLWPRNFSWDAYKSVFKTNTIFIGYKNTLIRTIIGAVLTLFVTLLASFAMTHKEMPGWSLINFLIVFTMFFGGGLIPNYLNLKALGLLNTIWVLIIPGIAGAWNFLIMRNFINSIGKELEEAAYIDGASPWQTLFTIVMPLSKAVMAVIGLWSVVGHWNAWFDSLTYANKKELVVLQTVIRRLIDVGEEEVAAGEGMSMADATPETIRCATVMIATLPILAGYPFIQKYLVKGTMVGALKG